MVIEAFGVRMASRIVLSSSKAGRVQGIGYMEKVGMKKDFTRQGVAPDCPGTLAHFIHQ
jgi:hypothetical protein